jgi:hypothetical protein
MFVNIINTMPAKLPIADFKTQAEWHSYLDMLKPTQLKKVSSALNKILRKEFKLDTKKPATELLADVKKLYSVNNSTKLLEIVKGIPAEDLPQPSQNLPKPTKKQDIIAKEAEKKNNIDELTPTQLRNLKMELLDDENQIYEYSPYIEQRKLLTNLAIEKGLIRVEKPTKQKKKTQTELITDLLTQIEKSNINKSKIDKLATQDLRRVKEQKQYERAVERDIQKGTISRAIKRIGKENPKFASKDIQILASAEMRNMYLQPKNRQQKRTDDAVITGRLPISLAYK